jgi:SAM-dependent methyltransferase
VSDQPLPMETQQQLGAGLGHRIPKQDTVSLFCPACCQIIEHQLLYSITDCDILRCRSCGLGRTEAQAFNPTSYYTSDYFSGRRSDGYANYLGSELVLRREFARTVKFIRKWHGRGRLLEVGCAYGYFLQEAKPYFDVFGIELAADAAIHCRKSGYQVVTGTADETTLHQIGSTDVIVLLDVIEHLPDPRETLRLLTRHLNPGGIIIITTGEFDSHVARLFGRRWRLMTPPQHLWFFSRDSLRKIASSLGLRLEHVDHPWKIVPLSLMVFQLRRMLRLPAYLRSRGMNIGLPVNLFDAVRLVLRKPHNE